MNEERPERALRASFEAGEITLREYVRAIVPIYRRNFVASEDQLRDLIAEFRAAVEEVEIPEASREPITRALEQLAGALGGLRELLERFTDDLGVSS